jgi:hypothetical protein
MSGTALRGADRGVVVVMAVMLLVVPATLVRSVQAGPAIGQFEMKDLEAEPGEIEFQSQNAYALGLPPRKFARTNDGSLVYDENDATRQRHALEIEMSVTHFLRMRVGIEFEKERFDDPATPATAEAFDDLKLTEVAVEGVVILKPIPESGGVGFGILAEYERPIGGGELNTILFGPILGASGGAWSTLLNVMIIKHYGAGSIDQSGERERDDKWDIGYAAQVKYDFSAHWALALEGYGTIDRIGNSGARSEAAALLGDHDQHRAGPVLYHEWRGGGLAGADKTLGMATTLSRDAKRDAGKDDDDDGVLYRFGTGVLFGLNEATPGTTLKLSFEAEF